jgi:hypothetical protein
MAYRIYLKQLHNITNYTACYGVLFGTLGYSTSELTTKPLIFDIKSDKGKIYRGLDILSEGVKGGVIWGVFGKTYPITLPLYIGYNIYDNYKSKESNEEELK